MNWKVQGDPTHMPGWQGWLRGGVLLSPSGGSPPHATVSGPTRGGKGTETAEFLEAQPRGPPNIMSTTFC